LYDPSRLAESGPPEPRHIAIAACQGDQLAKEVPWNQSKRGAFSAAFEEAVRSLGPSATYVDLITAVRTKVRSRVADQVPNLYVSGGSSGNDLLLGGHSARRNLTLDADQDGHWWISSGAIDGIPSLASVRRRHHSTRHARTQHRPRSHRRVRDGGARQGAARWQQPALQRGGSSRCRTRAIHRLNRRR
jgi:hypothetical protein